MMKDEIRKIESEAKKSLAKVSNEDEMKEWENMHLGRKSALNDIAKGLKDLSPEEKKEVGPIVNEVKRNLETLAIEARERIENEVLSSDAEWIDVTVPGKAKKRGHLHPITILEREIEEIFISLGFDVADGPEVETEFYNFDALNVPADHPARDMQDTFWLKSEELKDRYLLRTHTSPVQVRFMEKNTPPFRVIVPGRIFRNEATDASHEHTFHQFECLMVGDDVSVANFKWIAETFFSRFFRKEIEIRLRPSFFPFTEPSFEFDISCMLCDGRGCSVCKQSGWLEIGGAGMVNQKVFEAAGYERGKYQGFAWGFGLTRLAMMKYKISDIRLLMSGDLRFIKQF